MAAEDEMAFLNNEGDYVTEYIVELGRKNDLKPRTTRVVVAKCDYMAAEIAEKMMDGYIAFAVYRK